MNMDIVKRGFGYYSKEGQHIIVRKIGILLKGLGHY